VAVSFARKILIAATVLGITARAGGLIVYGNPSEPNLWEFGVIARNLIEHGGFAFFHPNAPSAYMPPGFPLLIAGLYAVFGIGHAAHWILAAILLAAGIALPFVVRRIAVQVWDHDVAVVAFVLAMVWPHLILMNAGFTGLPISTLLLALAISVAIDTRAKGFGRVAACGLLLGGYSLIRFEGLLFVLPIGYLIFRQMSNRSVRARIGALVVFIVLTAAPLAPWVARNYAVFGTPLLSTSAGFNLARGHNEFTVGTGRDPRTGEWAELPGNPPVALDDIEESADELARDRYFRAAAIEYARSHPVRELELAMRKAFYFLVADFTHPADRIVFVWFPTFVAFVVGLWHWIRTGRGDPAQQALWLVFAVQFAIALVFFVVPRYRMAVAWVPVLFLAARTLRYASCSFGRSFASP